MGLSWLTVGLPSHAQQVLNILAGLPVGGAGVVNAGHAAVVIGAEPEEVGIRLSPRYHELWVCKVREIDFQGGDIHRIDDGELEVMMMELEPVGVGRLIDWLALRDLAFVKADTAT